MLYSIIGSSRYTVQEEQIEVACAEIGADLIGYTVDTDNDRHPLYFINVESKLLLAERRIKDVFGSEFELRNEGEKK